MPPGHPQAIPVPQSTPLVGIKQVQIQQLVQVNQTLTQIAANTAKIGVAGPKAFNTWSASVKSFGKELGTVSSNLNKMKDSIGSIAKVSLGTFAAAGAAITGLAAAASSDVWDTFTGSFGLLAAQVGRMFTPALIEASYAIQGIAKYVKEMDPAVKSQIVEWGKMGLLIAGAAAIGIAVLPAFSAAVSMVSNAVSIAASGFKILLSTVGFVIAHPVIAGVLALAAAVAYLAYQLHRVVEEHDEMKRTLAGYGIQMSKAQMQADPIVAAIQSRPRAEQLAIAKEQQARAKADYDEAVREHDKLANLKDKGIVGWFARGTVSALGIPQQRKQQVTETFKHLENMNALVDELSGNQRKFGQGFAPKAQGFGEFAGNLLGGIKGFAGDVKGEGFGPAIQKLIGNIMPKNLAGEFAKLQKDVAGGPDRPLAKNINANPAIMGVQEAWRQGQMAAANAAARTLDAQRLQIQIEERNILNQWLPKIANGIAGMLGLKPVGPAQGGAGKGPMGAGIAVGGMGMG